MNGNLPAGNHRLHAETSVDRRVADRNRVYRAEGCDRPWWDRLDQHPVAQRVNCPDAYEHAGYGDACRLACFRPAGLRAEVIDERDVPADRRAFQPCSRACDQKAAVNAGELNLPFTPDWLYGCNLACAVVVGV